jgi:hypothetical protein
VESEGQAEKDSLKTFQHLVPGEGSKSKADTGLRYSPPLNLIRLPPGNNQFFDADPILLVVPILSLEEIQAWTFGKRKKIWVLCIVGDGKDAKSDELIPVVFGKSR